MDMTTYAVVGTPVTRDDGPEKVSGKTCYAGDLRLPGMLWGKVLRSPLPHARIVRMDTSGALQLPGVHAVLTGRDLAGRLVGRTLRDTPLLAQEKVRFVGERVAAVAADDVDTAEEALTRIEVEYAELPAVFDPVEAMQPGAPVVHDGAPAYEGPAGLVYPHGNISHQTTWAGGDVEQGFREADLLFEHTFTTPWVHQGYLEPYACMVAIDEAGRIQVWANNKQPFRLRWQLASAPGLPEDRIRVNPCAIGGDFGGKAGAMDVPLAYALAQRVGRPVKMIMDYVEELLAGNPRHPAVITIKSGVKQDGRLWARHTRVVYNGGGFGGVPGAPTLWGGRPAAEVGMTRLDTDAVPFDTGAGAGTSVGAAHAALGAAQDVRHQLSHVAAECYVWPQERIVFRHGRVFVDDAPERGVAFHEVAARAVAALGHPVVGEMTTTAAEPEVTAYCAQVAEVEVDPDTGQVTVHRLVTAHDVGTIINPLDHQGQIDGAVMQGLGYALIEGLHADEGRITTLSLGEAKIPTMQDIPVLVTVLVESPGGEGPYQGKAIGENPISPVAPAIANAVYDAVGVRIQDLPITAEKVRFAS